MVSKETKLTWEEGNILHELEFRNVGDKNDAQIQFVLTRYNVDKQRNLPLVCFNIYKKDVKAFIDGVIKEV